MTNTAGNAYALTFSEPVTTSNTFVEYNLLMWSPGSAGWFPIAWATPTTSATQTVIEQNGDTDCTAFVILAQPANATAANQFQVAAPISPVS